MYPIDYDLIVWQLKEYYKVHTNATELQKAIKLLTPDQQYTLEIIYSTDIRLKRNKSLRLHHSKKLHYIRKKLISYINFLQADMTFIIGRSGSGKSTFESYLKEVLQWNSIESYTTRPPRFKNEPGHTYITWDDVQKNPEYFKENRIAETIINNNLYFATREQFNHANIYIIDPNGFYQILENFPNKLFNLVYLKVPESILKKQLKKRSKETSETASLQESRLASENQQFTDFENKLKLKDLPKNINIVSPKTYFKNYYSQYQKK